MDLNVVLTLRVKERCEVNADYSCTIVEKHVTIRAEYQCPEVLRGNQQRERDRAIYSKYLLTNHKIRGNER